MFFYPFKLRALAEGLLPQDQEDDNVEFFLLIKKRPQTKTIVTNQDEALGDVLERTMVPGSGVLNTPWSTEVTYSSSVRLTPSSANLASSMLTSPDLTWRSKRMTISSLKVDHLGANVSFSIEQGLNGLHNGD